jgi:hypothetical protein
LSLKTISFFALLFVSLTFISCSSDPSAIGSAYLKGDQIKLDSLDSYKDTLPQVSSTYQYSVPLGYATSFLLGHNGSNVANMLMNFNIILPDTITTELQNNTLTVTSAFVQLYKSYNYGDSTAPFDFSVHQINNGWNSTTFTIDSFNVWQPGNQYVAADIGFNKSFTDTIYQFNISNDLALSWISSVAKSLTLYNGILLTPTSGTNKIVGFYALSPTTSVDIPYINIVVNKSGFYVDTLRFSTTADLSVVSGSIPQNQQTDYIYAQSSVILESRLKFDISKLPPHAIINYAELDLTADTTKSIFGSPFTDQLQAKFITDSTHIDSLSTSAVALTRATGSSVYTGNITYFVQTWLSTKINMGIQIQPSDYTEGVDLWTIYGSKATDLTKRPRLKITYTNKL